MVKLCSLLEPFDILSPSPILYSKGQKHFISYSGIIISLVIYAFFLILILYFMIDFINGSGVSIIYSKDEVSENFNLNLKLSLYLYIYNKTLFFPLLNLMGYPQRKV